MRSETSFEFDGDLIIVDAVVVGPSGQADVRLVLDTGAVLTTSCIGSRSRSISAPARGSTYERRCTATEPWPSCAATSSPVAPPRRAIELCVRRSACGVITGTPAASQRSRQW